MLLKVDDEEMTHIHHSNGSMCKRVARSVMAAKIFASVYGIDLAFVIRDTPSEILSAYLPLNAYVDSRTLFDVITRQSGTQKKRLQTDVFTLR